MTTRPIAALAAAALLAPVAAPAQQGDRLLIDAARDLLAAQDPALDPASVTLEGTGDGGLRMLVGDRPVDCLPRALLGPGRPGGDIGLADHVAGSAGAPSCAGIESGFAGGRKLALELGLPDAVRFEAITEERLAEAAELQAEAVRLLGEGARVEATGAALLGEGEVFSPVFRIVAPDGTEFMGIPTGNPTGIDGIVPPEGDRLGGLRLVVVPGPNGEEETALGAITSDGRPIPAQCSFPEGTLLDDCLMSAVGLQLAGIDGGPPEFRGTGVIADSEGLIALTAAHVANLTFNPWALDNVVEVYGGVVIGDTFEGVRTRADAANVRPPNSHDRLRLAPGLAEAPLEWHCAADDACVEIDLAVFRLDAPLEMVAGGGTFIPHHPILRARDGVPSRLHEGVIHGMAAGYGLDSAQGGTPSANSAGIRRRGYFLIGDCGLATLRGCEDGFRFPAATAANLLLEEDGTTVPADPCEYDSGAPIYVEMEDGTLAVAGLLQRSLLRGADCTSLNAFVDLTNPLIQDWLLDRAAELSGTGRDAMAARMLTAEGLEIKPAETRIASGGGPDR